MASAITAHGTLYGFILLYRGFCHEQTKLKDFQHLAVRIGNHGFDRLFIEAVHLHTTVSKPPFDLSRGVGVIQPSQFIGSGGDGFLVLGIAEDCVCHQFTVNQNATVVDLLVHLVEPHLTFGNWVVPQLVADLTLRIHISDTVGFEPLPLFRLVGREVSGSAAVGLGRLTWHGEEADKVCTFLQLLSLNVQHLTNAVQGEGQSQHCRLHRCTLPSCRRQLLAQVLGNTRALKCGIERCLYHRGIFQRIQHLLGKLLPTGKIDDFSRLIIKGVGKQQYFKLRTVAIGIHAGLGQIHIRICFNINSQQGHAITPFA